MRTFRLIACAALALPVSACTIWYVATNPYGGDASADAHDLGDASDDVIVASPPVAVFSGASAITTFGDTLYANLNGALWSCADVDTSSCATLGILVPAGVGTVTPVGLTASDAGVFWVTGDGIWVADLDGGNARRAIVDVNKPEAIAIDGTRLSWTALHAGTTVIDTCEVATTVGCNLDGGVSGPNQGQLVAGDANVDNSQLAAGPGYVVWASSSTQNAVVSVTAIEGGLTSTYDPQETALADMSDNTWVTNDGQNVFVSFQNNADSRFVVYQVLPTQSTLDASPTHGRVNGVAKSYCMTASAGLIGYGPRTNQVTVSAENGGAAPIALQWMNEGGVKEGALAFAATTHFYFVLAADYTLYRYAR